MEMIRRKAQSNQRGMSMIEMMIASVVLIVGVLSSAILIPLSIATNNRNKQQSNSTVVAQMVMEKIMSVPANPATILAITDCTGAVSSLNTTGSAAPGAGATLLGSGVVDFSTAAPAGYSMLYTTCGTGGRQATYDVRWNIRTLSNFVKLVTVSARRQNATTNPNGFALPVTIRSMAGQGS
jgi:Tfp pilus assembly protein PilV